MRLADLAWLPLATLPLALASAQPGAFLDNPSFDHFYNLEYDQALAGFMAAAAKDPDSPNIQNHIAQTILYREMFRAGILQTQMLGSSNFFLKTPELEMSLADQRQFSDAIRRAMELEQSRLGENPNDTAALYALGVSHSLLGQYDFVVRKAYLDALHDITHARKCHARLTRLDPDWVDAQLTQGVFDYVIGSLHVGWKMLGYLGGLEGNRTRGIAAINRVATQGNLNRIDATIVLATIYRREHRSADAICVLKPLIPLLPRNYLLRLELAGMYADLGDRSAALDALDQVGRLWREHAPGYATLDVDLLRKVREHILTTIASNGATPRG
jgi:tetratricopeptide (TPR) repeat protein